jgi:drug/metabolite transporter (DMT)-like permease
MAQIRHTSTASPYRFIHLIVVYLVWGSAYFAVKMVVHGQASVSPLQLQTWRMWSASALLTVGSVLWMRRFPRISRGSLALCATTGILMWVLGNGLATLASRHAASAFIVMAMGMIPLWTILLASIREARIPSRRILTGIASGFAGLLAIFGPPALAGDTSLVESGYGVWVGLVLLAAGSTWALGTILQKPMLAAVSPPLAAGLQMLFAAIALTILSLVTEETLAVPADPSTQQIGAFLYLVIFASAICLMSYLNVLKSFSPAVASTFAYVNPIVGVGLGWWIVDEAVTTWSLTGMALVFMGVFIVLFEQPRTNTQKPVLQDG